MLVRQRSATSSVVDVNRQRISQSEAGIELAKALLETAELNLSYTIITAPCNGYTSRKEIQVGQLVQPGQTLLDIIESGDVWVAANYKETQLHHIVPGSKGGNKGGCYPGSSFQRKYPINLYSYRCFTFTDPAGQFSRKFRKGASANTRKD